MSAWEAELLRRGLSQEPTSPAMKKRCVEKAVQAGLLCGDTPEQAQAWADDNWAQMLWIVRGEMISRATFNQRMSKND